MTGSSRTASCTPSSQRVAALLYEAGLRPGDGVALVLPNRPEFFEITWGCQLSGLYYSAVNTHFTPDEVVYVVNDSDAKAVFVDESMADLAEQIRRDERGRRRPHQCRRRAARLAVLPRRGGVRGRRSAGLGRNRDALLVRNNRAAQGRSSAAADRRPRFMGAEGLEYALAQRYDMTAVERVPVAGTAVSRGRASTTRWRSTGWAPHRS